jgi:drug/metabolite transporter (DMT)-like permease
MTLLLGVFLHGHKVARREWAAMALCYLGVAAAFAHDLELSTETSAVWVGAAFVLASCLCYAFYLVGSGTMLARVGVARFTALTMLVSTAATLVHFLTTQPFSALVRCCPSMATGGDGVNDVIPCLPSGGDPPHRQRLRGVSAPSVRR